MTLPETSRIKLILSPSPVVVFTRCLDPGAKTSICANATARRCQNNRQRPGCVNQSVLKRGCVQRGSGPESAGCADTAAPAKRSVCRGSLHLAAQRSRTTAVCLLYISTRRGVLARFCLLDSYPVDPESCEEGAIFVTLQEVVVKFSR